MNSLSHWLFPWKRNFLWESKLSKAEVHSFSIDSSFRSSPFPAHCDGQQMSGLSASLMSHYELLLMFLVKRKPFPGVDSSSFLIVSHERTLRRLQQFKVQECLAQRHASCTKHWHSKNWCCFRCPVSRSFQKKKWQYAEYIRICNTKFQKSFDKLISIVVFEVTVGVKEHLQYIILLVSLRHLRFLPILAN